MQRKATRADVAQRAGVSKTTVTLVVNGRTDVAIPARTRERVLAIAQELGYRPHPTALALATGRTNVVTAIVPCVATPYYARITETLLDQAYARGFGLVISKCDFFQAPSSLYWSVTALSDGVLVVGGHSATRELFESVNALSAPVVSMGVGSIEDTDFVQMDLYAGALQAVTHLLEARPKRLAYLYPSFGQPLEAIPDGRLAAYRDGLTRAGQPLELIAAPTEARRDAMQAVRDHLSGHGCPEALFCQNDDMAIGAYRALHERGLRIGEDIRVVGYDGIEESEYQDPPLSTVVQPIETMCERAWQFLENRLAAPSTPLRHEILTPALTVRASSASSPPVVE